MKLSEFSELLNELHIQFVLIDALSKELAAKESPMKDLLETMQRRAERDFDFLCKRWVEARDEFTTILDDLILEK